MSRARERMSGAALDSLEKRAREHVDSVPYTVSLRWVFYRLLQDGLYFAKDDYSKFTAQASKWRHDGTWPPDILADETREAISRGNGAAYSTEEVVRELLDSRTLRGWFYDSHWRVQETYVEIWFEARAMTAQFEHYTRDITLRPFGGMTSIPMKYAAAKDLEYRSSQYGKPCRILYFGDSDNAGKTIFSASTTGEKGFLKWCAADVSVEWCGLTAEQARAMDVPENPDKPGDFQWEALTDEQAEKLIGQALQENLNISAIAEARKTAAGKADRFAARLSAVIGGADFGDEE